MEVQWRPTCRLRHVKGVSLRNLHLHGKYLSCDYLFTYTLEWRPSPAADTQRVGQSNSHESMAWQSLYVSEEARGDLSVEWDRIQHLEWAEGRKPVAAGAHHHFAPPPLDDAAPHDVRLRVWARVAPRWSATHMRAGAGQHGAQPSAIPAACSPRPPSRPPAQAAPSLLGRTQAGPGSAQADEEPLVAVSLHVEGGSNAHVQVLLTVTKQAAARHVGAGNENSSITSNSGTQQAQPTPSLAAAPARSLPVQPSTALAGPRGHMQLVLELTFGLHELVTVDEARLARTWPGTNVVLLEMGYGSTLGMGAGGGSRHSGTHVMATPCRSLPLQALMVVAAEPLPRHLLYNSAAGAAVSGHWQSGSGLLGAQKGVVQGRQGQQSQALKPGGFAGMVETAAAGVQQQQELCMWMAGNSSIMSPLGGQESMELGEEGAPQPLDAAQRMAQVGRMTRPESAAASVAVAAEAAAASGFVPGVMAMLFGNVPASRAPSPSPWPVTRTPSPSLPSHGQSQSSSTSNLMTTTSGPPGVMAPALPPTALGAGTRPVSQPIATAAGARGLQPATSSSTSALSALEASHEAEVVAAASVSGGVRMLERTVGAGTGMAHATAGASGRHVRSASDMHPGLAAPHDITLGTGGGPAGSRAGRAPGVRGAAAGVHGRTPQSEHSSGTRVVKMYDVMDVRAGISRLGAQQERLAAAQTRRARVQERLEALLDVHSVTASRAQQLHEGREALRTLRTASERRAATLVEARTTLDARRTALRRRCETLVMACRHLKEAGARQVDAAEALAGAAGEGAWRALHADVAGRVNALVSRLAAVYALGPRGATLTVASRDIALKPVSSSQLGYTVPGPPAGAAAAAGADAGALATAVTGAVAQLQRHSKGSARDVYGADGLVAALEAAPLEEQIDASWWAMGGGTGSPSDGGSTRSSSNGGHSSDGGSTSVSSSGLDAIIQSVLQNPLPQPAMGMPPTHNNQAVPTGGAATAAAPVGVSSNSSTQQQSVLRRPNGHQQPSATSTRGPSVPQLPVPPAAGAGPPALSVLGLELPASLAKRSLEGAVGWSGSHDEEQRVAAALGYVAHMVERVARYTGVLLRYPLHPALSSSAICDPCPPMAPTYLAQLATPVQGPLARGLSLLLSPFAAPADTPPPAWALMTRPRASTGRGTPPDPTPLVLPLHYEGRDRTRFAYAIYLLNKDVEQLLHAHGLSSAGPAQLLPNLYMLALAATSGAM